LHFNILVLSKLNKLQRISLAMLCFGLWNLPCPVLSLIVSLVVSWKYWNGGVMPPQVIP